MKLISLDRARVRAATSSSSSKKPSKKAERKKAALSFIGKNSSTEAASKDNDLSKAFSAAKVYEELLVTYKKKPHLKVFKYPLSAQARTKLLAVVAAAAELEVDCTTYIKAQFHVFNDWFSRAPKLHEISSAKSKERVKTYLQGVADSSIRPDAEIKTKVIASPKVSREAKFAHSELQLRSLMMNWNLTAEQVFKSFCQGTHALQYFDREWLKQNKIYQQLKRDGEV